MKKYVVTVAFLFLPSLAWAAPVMDIGPLVNTILMFILALIGITIVKAVLTSRSVKGRIGEFLVRHAVSSGLDPQRYHQLHDVTLPTADGTTQIDHIIVSVFGIFVIETKNMGGWIFGNPHQPKWTQTFGKSKNSFQNPLRQNYKHIMELEALLQIGEHKLFSVVVFTGDAQFKTDMPDNVIRSGQLGKYVRSRDAFLLTESEVQRILMKINAAMLERSRETSRQHVRHLDRKFGNSTGEMFGERQRILKKLGVIAGIMLVGAFFLNLSKAPSRQPSTAVTTAASMPVQQAPIVFQQPETPKPKKIPRSEDFGILTLSAQKDTFVTLYDVNNAAVFRAEIRKGQSEDVEIRRGAYKAEILQAGKREISTVSFIGSTGVLEF